MLNPGLSALWDEEILRRKLKDLNTPMETPDLTGSLKLSILSIII